MQGWGFSVGWLWDATGKWAIHFLLGPFLFWSLPSLPRSINTFCIAAWWVMLMAFLTWGPLGPEPLWEVPN